MKSLTVLSRLTPYMGNKKYLLSLSLILSALSSVLALLPFILLWLIVREYFSAAPTADKITTYAWLTLASALLAMLMYFCTLLCSHLAAFRVEVGLRKIGMSKIINMPLGFFADNQSGKVRKVIDDNASETHTFIAHQLPDLSATIIAPLVILLLMFLIDWRMGLVSLIPIVLGIVSMSFMMTEKGEAFRQEYMNHQEAMSSEAIEYVRGIAVVKTFGQSVHAFSRFVDSINRYRDSVMTMTLMWRKSMSFYTVIMQSVAPFLVPFALFVMTDHNTATVLSDFIFYLIIAPNFTLLFMRSMYFQNTVSIAKQSIDRFDAILDYPEMPFVRQSEPLQSFDVEFKNVVFAYQETTDQALKSKALANAVDGVSFTIKTGETVALIGTSGSGKTTIARLLARFWDIDAGEILIGGRNIKTLSKPALMNSIAFVFQSPKLFDQSLRSNITYGTPDATQAQIDHAIESSQSTDIINALPNGLDTQIGSSGTYLSGGEQQRIGLARAMLKDAPIVILDEATAFADPENEHLIQKALSKLSQNKTTLMIAHRLTTVKDADKILVLDHGKIVQHGTHESLMLEGGLYKTMWDEYQQSIDWKLMSHDASVNIEADPDADVVANANVDVNMDTNGVARGEI